MTQLPLWAVYVVAFGTPLAALGGVVVTQWLARRTAREGGAQSRREELLRNLRWAAELAASDHEVSRRVGVGQLVAWGRLAELEPRDQIFVDAALEVVLEDRRPSPGAARSLAATDVLFLESPDDRPSVGWPESSGEAEVES